MTAFEKAVGAIARRYLGEVYELTRAQRTLPPAERALSKTHANVKEACANELLRLMHTHGLTA